MTAGHRWQSAYLLANTRRFFSIERCHRSERAAAGVAKAILKIVLTILNIAQLSRMLNLWKFE
jgi:hypothetical protein